MNSNWSYSPETPNLGKKNDDFFSRVTLKFDIWWMTLKNSKAPLLSNIKFFASFHHHMGIQTGVTVQKRLSWGLTSGILTFHLWDLDLWPWPFAWISRLSMVITPENFMMIQWKEHCEKSVTDGQTDRQTDGRTDGWTEVFLELLSCS